jgi:hypothetical protein
VIRPIHVSPVTVSRVFFFAAIAISVASSLVGALGLVEAREMFPVAVGACIVAALSALAYSTFWEWDWHKSHHQR